MTALAKLVCKTAEMCTDALARFPRSEYTEEVDPVFLNCQPYSATPLPGPSFVRLLEVRAGAGPHVDCSLHTVDLENAPPYDALSYTWGDHRAPSFHTISPGQSRRRLPIFCDGRVLFVTANLHEWLLRLRSMGYGHPTCNGIVRQKYIWIDAVCINQGDLAERSSQVSMMGKIYKSANLVISWLGREDRDTEHAL